MSWLPSQMQVQASFRSLVPSLFVAFKKWVSETDLVASNHTAERCYNIPKKDRAMLHRALCTIPSPDYSLDRQCHSASHCWSCLAFRLCYSVREVQAKAKSSIVASENVDNHNYLSTYWDRKISRFVLIPLVSDHLFDYESGTETSRALGLHNLRFRGSKDAQVVHKQNKRDVAIICRVRLEPKLNTRFITLFFRSACGHDIMCQQE